MISKLERPANPGQIWRVPVYWPDDIRHRGDVSLIWALMLNCGNLSQRCEEKKPKQRPCEAESIEALHRDGQTCSSEETAVMAVERRGLVIQFSTKTNCKTG